MLAGALVLGVGILRAEEPPRFDPTGELAIVLFEDSAEPRPLRDGEKLARDARVAFDVDVEGGDYLYLLLLAGEGLRVLVPPTGLAWMDADGAQRIIPHPANRTPDQPVPLSWTSEESGQLEFVLVAAPAPRDVASVVGQIDSIEDFLLPPPYVRGPVARPGVVLDRVEVRWRHF